MKSLSRVRLFATLWTVAHQAPPSMGFSRQEYWSGLPFHSPGDLPNPGIEPGSPALEADALTFEPPGKPIALYKCSSSKTIAKNNDDYIYIYIYIYICIYIHTHMENEQFPTYLWVKSSQNLFHLA